MVNYLAIRFTNQEADRWSSFLYWKFAITSIAIWPFWFLVLLRYKKYRRAYRIAFYVVSIVVGAWLGFFFATLIVDWTNCINVSYCVDVDYPPTHDGPDASFYITFFGTLYFLVFIVIWILSVARIVDRLRGLSWVERNSDPYRPLDASDPSYILSPIGNNMHSSAQQTPAVSHCTGLTVVPMGGSTMMKRS